MIFFIFQTLRSQNLIAIQQQAVHQYSGGSREGGPSGNFWICHCAYRKIYFHMQNNICYNSLGPTDHTCSRSSNEPALVDKIILIFLQCVKTDFAASWQFQKMKIHDAMMNRPLRKCHPFFNIYSHNDMIEHERINKYIIFNINTKYIYWSRKGKIRRNEKK